MRATIKSGAEPVGFSGFTDTQNDLNRWAAFAARECRAARVLPEHASARTGARPFAESGEAENGFKALAVTDDVSKMDLEKVGPGTETFGEVSDTLWRKTVLTSCVLAGCLAVIAVLTIF
jgi:hypothetical protein